MFGVIALIYAIHDSVATYEPLPPRGRRMSRPQVLSEFGLKENEIEVTQGQNSTQIHPVPLTRRFAAQPRQVVLGDQQLVRVRSHDREIL